MFRFTIRDVLLAMAALGLALGWYLEHARHASTRDQLHGVVDTLEAAGVEMEASPDHVYVKGNSFESYTSLSKHDPKTPTKVLGAKPAPLIQKASPDES
jgi:hypothetical protein